MIERSFANMASSARRERRSFATDDVDVLSNSDPPAKEKPISG
ncbi:hypothetical protein BVRB_9g212070 [Beta vulgaris subsp. vulgaris]|nr:hypothetical protein BVRB_9g212070 [Beta vulgaris subsp. vulgaris]